MTPLTDTIRIKVEYAKNNGDEAALKAFNITSETLSRYQRLAKHIPSRPNHPQILIFDIETMPLEVYVWGLYLQRINHDNIIKDWYIVTWSAKWLFDEEIKSDGLTPEEALAGDDSRICRGIWNLFESADIVIAHNAVRFDIRRLNARWMLNGLKPPSPYMVIDTLQKSRTMAAHASHRLDYLGKLMLQKGKIETNFKLWKRCKEGDQEALTEMEIYNREDTALLEEVYLEIRPWMKSHPNTGLFMDGDMPVCPTCGHDKLIPIDPYFTSVGMYPGYRCAECGAISRGRFTEVELKKRKNMIVGTAR